MNNNKEIFNKTQLYADKVKILNYLFFVDEMAAVLGYDLSMAREFLWKELSNVGIIICETQSSLKRGFLSFTFQKHEQYTLSRCSFDCIPLLSEVEVDK